MSEPQAHFAITNRRGINILLGLLITNSDNYEDEDIDNIFGRFTDIGLDIKPYNINYSSLKHYESLNLVGIYRLFVRIDNGEWHYTGDITTPCLNN